MSNQCLFVGGPLDGQRIALSDKANVVEMGQRSEPLPPLPLGASIETVMALSVPALYRRERIHVENGYLSIFLHGGMTLRQGLEMLLKEYRPQPTRP